MRATAITLRKQDGELVGPDDGIQPIPNDRIGQFLVPLDRPFECPRGPRPRIAPLLGPAGSC